MGTDKNDVAAIHEEAVKQAIAHGIDKDEMVVAVTRDGKVYVGRAIPPTKLQQTVMKSRFLTTLLTWIGNVVNFFLITILRLPYLLDHIRTIKARNREKQ